MNGCYYRIIKCYYNMTSCKNGLFIIIFNLLFLSACKKEIILSKSDYKALGSSAHDLLAASPYEALQIDINYMPGFSADTASISNLVIFLNKYLNKPGGIKVFQHQIATSNKSILTVPEIVNIEVRNRTFFTTPGLLCVHILITDGYFSSPETFATSYWNTSICIFGQTIKDNSDRPYFVSKSRLISTVLQHEIGHLLGLVGQGSPMQHNHKDVANGAHCVDTNCLMHYSINTNAGSMVNPIPPPDTDCLNDLKANGGK